MFAEEKTSSLKIKNTKGIKFYVKIENFYPERCIPEFKFYPPEKKFQIQLCGPLQFF
jgi:hypothetical protein